MAIPAIATLALSLQIAPPAFAKGRDTARVMMLDRCVNDEYRRQRNSDGVVKRCQCASKKALEALSPSDIANVSFGSSLPRGMRRELAAALQMCK
ncbi:hypothetical protein D1F64_11805 [Breoghania sp. L-A4]|nr:hypothetical protein D1F64_11805 [Breoghania sp. L-A4]